MKYNPILIGSRIKEARSNKDLRQLELAKLLGVSESTVSRYENGEVGRMNLSFLRNISNLLEVREDWLLGLSNKRDPENKGLEYVNCPYIPDPVAAGVPDTIQGFSELPTLPVPKTFLGKYANRKDLVLMKVSGESMNNIIPSGSYICLITDIEVENLKDGDLVVFSQEYNYSLKHYYNLGNEVLFKPNSSDLSFREMRYKKNVNLNIVGRVIMYNIGLE